MTVWMPTIIDPLDGLNGVEDVVQFVCPRAILPVVLDREVLGLCQHLDDGQVIRLSGQGKTTPGSEPLADDPVVLDPAGLGFPRAKVEVVALDGQDGLPGSFVATLRGGRLDEFRHVSPNQMCKTVCTVLPSAIGAALPTDDRYRKYLIRLCLR